MNLKPETRIGLGIVVCIMMTIGCMPAVPVDASDRSAQPVFSKGRRVGQLENEHLEEASGIASSRRRDDTLWVINDGGNGAYLYAAGLDGTDRGRFLLRNAANTDWEDLASFEWKGRNYLLVADIGDNKAGREHCVLYIVPEPKISRAGPPKQTVVDWRWKIRFIYEDGPRDSEAVAVDAAGKNILIITKRTSPPQLYLLPLASLDKSGVRVVRKVASLSTIPAPPEAYVLANPIFGRFGSQPTAMDITADGKWMAVLCYKNAYLFRIYPGKHWDAVFSQTPRTIELPIFAQAEALCFGRKDNSLFVTSEKRPAPLWRLDRHAP